MLPIIIGFTGMLHFCRHPTFQGLMGALLVHGRLDSIPLTNKNIGPNSLKELQALTMLTSSSFFWGPPALLDPPWTIISSWKPFVARRILMSRVIVSPILAPWQAREPATMARRILVISPESSHRRFEAVLVLARARMCGHLPLVCSAYAKKPMKWTSALLIGLFSFSPNATSIF